MIDLDGLSARGAIREVDYGVEPRHQPAKCFTPGATRDRSAGAKSRLTTPRFCRRGLGAGREVGHGPLTDSYPLPGLHVSRKDRVDMAPRW